MLSKQKGHYRLGRNTEIIRGLNNFYSYNNYLSNRDKECCFRNYESWFFKKSDSLNKNQYSDHCLNANSYALDNHRQMLFNGEE